MKRIPIIALLMVLGLSCSAQKYNISFTINGITDTMLYMGRHYRDEVRILDSARLEKGSYTFKGRHKWDRGVYCLVSQDRKTAAGDFIIDGVQTFSIKGDAMLAPGTVTVKGCPANKQMFDYQAVEGDARKAMDRIRALKNDPKTKAQGEVDEKALIDRMVAYEATARHPKNRNIFFELVNTCENPDVPDTVEDKARYYRIHYWDNIFENNNSQSPITSSQFLYSPQFFNKMNYFFFGLLYYADSDTICLALDQLMERMEGDTAMTRYVLEYITPKYFRATKNIGWDAVWCHIAEEYYLKGRCPWELEGNLHNMKYNLNRIKQSLIGAHGQEIWMADTNQSNNPKDWISSHRFPTKYVILWFWDPDCHHCQEQSAQLKVLYDSLQTAPDRRFEVYAVGYESDVEKWKKYVREHDFRWVNVGGTNVNIDYQEAYNVHGAPTMIILNEKRDIIMNKVLPIGTLLKFLDNYEKRGK